MKNTYRLVSIVLVFFALVFVLSAIYTQYDVRVLQQDHNNDRLVEALLKSTFSLTAAFMFGLVGWIFFIYSLPGKGKEKAHRTENGTEKDVQINWRYVAIFVTIIIFIIFIL